MSQICTVGVHVLWCVHVCAHVCACCDSKYTKHQPHCFFKASFLFFQHNVTDEEKDNICSGARGMLV